MNSYHIHIYGLVQGVGFRPYVYRLAKHRGLFGFVTNSKDGVHIEFNADEMTAIDFYKLVLHSPPANAVITSHSIKSIRFKAFDSFDIILESGTSNPDLLLTPDFAICDSCRQEIADENNERHHYPFTTCVECGPRYSISRKLPYERHHTTMRDLPLCDVCQEEYNDVNNRRHYSQTNSCATCAIPMRMFDANGQLVSADYSVVFKKLQEILNAGFIVAIKGIGGYLLICDATNEASIQLLRRRKHRPAKPFALLYDTIERALQDVDILDIERDELRSRAGPIVLCHLKPTQQNGICSASIAPGLDKIGLMLPSTPLLQLIATAFEKPMIATSANFSGSPIIYKDEEAIEALSGIADFILTYDRDILIPQDDSVVQITETGKKIIIRRCKGLAPNYFPNPFDSTEDCILAMGAELKSAFALQIHHQLYVSQYLGNQESLDAQTAFVHTAGHLLSLLQRKPTLLLRDKHPGYFVTQLSRDILVDENIPVIDIQHHHAHLGAVLAENHLMDISTPILGIIWDGAGYGDDKQIWGGEFFLFQDREMQRVAYLDYFPQLLGDKMNREPRLSALSLLKRDPASHHVLQNHFSITEWHFYQQLIKQPSELLTSSMGRLLDGIASLLNICQINTFEGEAAMKLEAIARKHIDPIADYYPLPLQNNRLDFSIMIQEILEDIFNKVTIGHIAKKTFYSLAWAISNIADYFSVEAIAFSGGVFQNALLTDMISDLLSCKKKLYWHRQLSPNDECISFGQLACYHLMPKNKIIEQSAVSLSESRLNHLSVN